MKTRNLFGILCVSIATLTAQSSIVYVNGPSFQAGAYRDWNPKGADFDGDGTNEFLFWSSGMICTHDVPTSGCSWPFYIRTGNTNEVVANGFYVTPLSLGEITAPQPPASSWIAPNGFYGACIASYWYSLQGREIDGQLLHSGWNTGVADKGVGYLGVRFYASDGAHYGWIRARLPQTSIGTNGFPLELVPVVVDWAYETQPDKPIRAGDIGTDGDSVQFKVEFFDPSPRHRQPRRFAGTGSLVLTDNNLRGELVLPGKFSSAELRGPTNPRARTKPVWSFGSPLVSSTNRTSFFGETTLTRAQIIALAHGLIYVSVDDCDLVGRITPVEHDRKRRR